MSVYQTEEYYVFIQFKEKLSDDQKEAIKDYLSYEELDYNGLTDDDLNIDFCQEAMEAEIFSDKFTEKFSNLIK
jgi:hypothetical protein